MDFVDADGVGTTIVGQTPTFVNLGSSRWMMPLLNSANLFGVTADWRAVCGRPACTVRRGERRKPMRRSYPYFEADLWM